MAFTGLIGAPASQGANVVPGLGSVLAPPAVAPTSPGYQDPTNLQVRAARWHRNRTRKLQALGLQDAGPPALPVLTTLLSDPADHHPAWFRLRQKRIERRRLIAALLYQQQYADSLDTGPVIVTPMPFDPAALHAALYRRRQKRLLRRKVREAMLYQHRYGVDVIDPFIVVRMVRSMLSAGAWEPGGY